MRAHELLEHLPGDGVNGRDRELEQLDCLSINPVVTGTSLDAKAEQAQQGPVAEFKLVALAFPVGVLEQLALADVLRDAVGRDREWTRLPPSQMAYANESVTLCM
jgi:hypothetical protein